MRPKRDVEAPLGQVGPDDPPTQAEMEEAERLRQGLETANVGHALADFAVGIRTMGRPSDPAFASRAEARIAEGIKRGAERNRFRRVRTLGGAAAVLSFAAAAILLIRTSGAPLEPTSASERSKGDLSSATQLNAPLRTNEAELRRSRSAAEYFLAEGPTRGGAGVAESSASLDHLIAARLDDYRENRFRAWGVR